MPKRPQDDDDIEEPDFPDSDEDSEPEDGPDLTRKLKSTKTPVHEESEDESDESEGSDESDDDDSLGSDIDPDDNIIVEPKTQDLPSKFALELEDYKDNDDDDDDENYLQRFDESIKQNIIADSHPELHVHNTDEIEVMTRIVRDQHGQIIDPLHRTVPFVTRYEKARILGERAKQINAGAQPLVEVDASVIDGYLIAQKEFVEKKIPFIVRRPMPNGGCEYWKLKDLEILA
jgi:DNA-directed RNA polymerase I, II, and III subunit RPABC2